MRTFFARATSINDAVATTTAANIEGNSGIDGEGVEGDDVGIEGGFGVTVDVVVGVCVDGEPGGFEGLGAGLAVAVGVIVGEGVGV